MDKGAGKYITREQREVRDGLILNLFLSGWTEREIAKHPRIALSAGHTHVVIVKQLEKAAERFGLISEKALIVYSERLEMLIKAIWTRAVSDRDPKAIEVARRLLEQQSRLYQISDERMAMPLAPMGDNELSDDVVELQRYRDRHRRPPDAM
jgi:hypothetical protein